MDWDNDYALSPERERRKWRIELPNIYDDELDPFQFRLLAHIVRRGVLFEAVRTTAKCTKMSVGMVSKTKKRLLADGWIERAIDPSTGRVGVRAVDVWDKNYGRFSATVCSPHEQTQQNSRSSDEQRSPHEQGVHSMNGHNEKRSPHEQERSLYEHKNKPIKKEPSEKKNQEKNGFWAIPKNLETTEFIRIWSRWVEHTNQANLLFTSAQSESLLQELSMLGPKVAYDRVNTAVMMGYKRVYLDDFQNNHSNGANGHKAGSRTRQALPANHVGGAK